MIIEKRNIVQRVTLHFEIFISHEWKKIKKVFFFKIRDNNVCYDELVSEKADIEKRTDSILLV